jgi:hypothetical protein
MSVQSISTCVTSCHCLHFLERITHYSALCLSRAFQPVLRLATASTSLREKFWRSNCSSCSWKKIFGGATDSLECEEKFWRSPKFVLFPLVGARSKMCTNCRLPSLFLLGAFLKVRRTLQAEGLAPGGLAGGPASQTLKLSRRVSIYWAQPNI